MIQINMLPWRERAREIKKKSFFVGLAISIGITLFIILLFHLYYDDLVRYQDKRNAFLQVEISQKQIEIDGLRKQKEQQAIIQTELQFLMNLRETNYRAVRLLNELLLIVPDAITLSKMEKENNLITLEGKAQSELAITAFLKRLSQSPLFNQPILTGISAKEENPGSAERLFQIKIEQKMPVQKEIDTTVKDGQKTSG